jgi:hypothetical protein
LTTLKRLTYGVIRVVSGLFPCITQ